MNSKTRKILLAGGAVLIAGSLLSTANANTTEVQAVPKVDLNKYLGTWHEIARKPLYFQNKCDYNVTAKYSLNENGNVKVDNSCYSADGKLNQSMGEAYN